MSHMAREPESPRGLHVVQIRYQGSERAEPESDPTDAYAASGAYERLGEAAVVEPEFPEGQRDEEPTVNLGLIGGEIAEAVAAGRRAGKPYWSSVGTVPWSLVWWAGSRRRTVRRRRWSRLVRRSRRFQYPSHHSLRYARRDAGRGLGRSGLPRWREMSHQVAPLPTDRIVMVDVRNLDPPEEQLVRATDVVIAAPAPGSRARIWSRRCGISPIVAISSICTSTPISSTSATSRTTTPRSQTAQHGAGAGRHRHGHGHRQGRDLRDGLGLGG